MSFVSACGGSGRFAHGALLEMRAAIFELRGGALAEQGLVAALGAHGSGLAVRYDVRVNVEGPTERLPLEPSHEEPLFRIGREAVTNAVKHSGSPTVSVQVAVEGGGVTLMIRDEGAGFDPTRSYRGHLGLELMRALAADAGGFIAIESAVGAGTTIRADVPTARSQASSRRGSPTKPATSRSTATECRQPGSSLAPGER
jgi:signal transduction histidine kinase